MASQARLNVDNTPVFRFGEPTVRDNQTFAQIPGRATDLVPFTVLYQNPATLQWGPITDETATDGSEIPRGISFATIAAADLDAGTVTGQIVYIKTGFMDEDSIVMENSLTLDTEATNQNKTFRTMLQEIDIIAETGIDVDRYENA